MQRSPLVTVTGPGGVGKTRLALQAAADQLPSFSDGAWLCELAAAGDGEAMAQAVAAALRARPRPGLSTAGSVVEFLRTRTALLLVLDNCEHLAAAAAALAADILRGCPGVRILATSQQPLGVGGEQVFGLRPLSLPPPDAGMAAAGASDAVSLFAQRAAAARGDFSLSPGERGRGRARSAGAWTGSRWRSSWPPPGWRRCARPRSPGCSMSGSGC